jgi:hypothetical protein
MFETTRSIGYEIISGNEYQANTNNNNNCSSTQNCRGAKMHTTILHGLEGNVMI